MVVDHLDAPTYLYFLTGGNRFFGSAAEGFLFISGLVMGLVYRPIVEKQGIGTAVKKAFKRAWLLYVVTVIATIGFMWLSLRLGLPWASGIKLGEAAIEVLLLLRTFYLTDVLLLYTVLITIAPVAFVLFQRRLTWVVLALSWGIWLAHQFQAIDMPWPSEEGAFYYIAAWQFLFMTGLAVGWNRPFIAQRMNWLISPIALLAASLGLFATLIAWNVGAQVMGEFYVDGGAVVANAFAKWNLPPLRLLACACIFGFMFLVIHYFWVPIRVTAGRALLPLGQSALFAYVFQLFAVAFLTYYRESIYRAEITSSMRGTLFQLAGVAFVWFGVRAYEWLGQLMRSQLPPTFVRRRIVPALGLSMVGLLSVGVVFTPVPSASFTGFAPVRDDRNSMDEPPYIIHVPPNATQQQPLPVMIVLHDREDNAEIFGQELIDFASRDGWLLVAPTISYRPDTLGPAAIAAESPTLIRGLREVISELPRNTGLILRRRHFVFGYGRGAGLAQRYAMANSGAVRAVALLGGAGYTLPPVDGATSDLKFPLGTVGFQERFGQPFDEASHRNIWYWVGVGSQDLDTNDVSGAWDDLLGKTRVDRAFTLSNMLQRAGVTVEFEVFEGDGHRLTPEMRLAVADFAKRVRTSMLASPPLPPMEPRRRSPLFR